MRTGERGYALLLAIAVVAALALAVLASARALGDVTASAHRLQERQIEAAAAETLMSRVAFLMLVEEHDAGALQIAGARQNQGAMRLDGTWYAIDGAPGSFLAVQDEAGLFNLNSSDEQGLRALLEVSGQGARAPSLAAALMDFTDPDDLMRDRGGEARAYERAGLLGPADRPLASRWQAIEALGWQDGGLLTSVVWTWLSAGPLETGLNINTAPAPVLQAVLGDARRAELIIRQREAGPLTDMAEVEALTAGTARANGVTFAVTPGRGFRVQAVFGSHGPRHGLERLLELGGGEAAAPFKWVEEREVRSAPLRDGEAINSLSLVAPAS